MMGDGVAFEFEGDMVCAPCDGEITVIAETKHAFGIKGNNGVEILIHIGLDTVNLKGKGFDVKVKVGSKVKCGEPLVALDRKVFEENNINLVTPLILTNYNDVDYKILETDREVSKNNVVVEIN